MLKRAQEIQLQDLEEEERNLLPLKTVASAKELSVRESKKTREFQIDYSTPSTQQIQHQKMLEQEKLSRQVFKEEISSLHCSGTRDLNTK
jgi:hypothetical protein